MFKMPRLKKGKAKILLGCIALLALIFLLVLLVPRTKVTNTSKATLTSSQNKFYLNLETIPGDQKNLSSFIKNLSLPQSILEGVTFQLESTSTAKLALLTPIKAQFSPNEKSIKFEGTLDHQATNQEINLSILKLPQSTNLVIATDNLKPYIQNNLKLPQNIKEWLVAATNGQDAKYFVLLGKDYSLIFPNKNVKIEDLKTLKDEKGESIYKENTAGDRKTYLIALPQDQNPEAAVIYQDDKNTYFISSINAQKEIQSAQDKDKNTFAFPPLDAPQKTSFALYLKNPQENSSEPSIWQVLFNSQEQKPEFLKKISTFFFALEKDRFSGIINLN